MKASFSIALLWGAKRETKESGIRLVVMKYIFSYHLNQFYFFTRIIYFTNLAMLFFIVRFAAQKVGLLKIASKVLISGIIIVSTGVLQLFLA